MEFQHRKDLSLVVQICFWICLLLFAVVASKTVLGTTRRPIPPDGLSHDSRFAWKVAT